MRLSKSARYYNPFTHTKSKSDTDMTVHPILKSFIFILLCQSAAPSKLHLWFFFNQNVLYYFMEFRQLKLERKLESWTIDVKCPISKPFVSRERHSQNRIYEVMLTLYFSKVTFGYPVVLMYQAKRGALGRAVEHSTSDHWVTGSKPGVFMSGALSSFVSLPGDRFVAHKTLAVKKRR